MWAENLGQPCESIVVRVPQGVRPNQKNASTAMGHREALDPPADGVPMPTLHPGDVVIFDRSAH